LIMDSTTVVIFGAGATKACGGPLKNEIISRGFDSAYHIDREDFLVKLHEFLNDNFFEVGAGIYYTRRYRC